MSLSVGVGKSNAKSVSVTVAVCCSWCVLWCLSINRFTLSEIKANQNEAINKRNLFNLFGWTLSIGRSVDVFSLLSLCVNFFFFPRFHCLFFSVLLYFILVHLYAYWVLFRFVSFVLCLDARSLFFFFIVVFATLETISLFRVSFALFFSFHFDLLICWIHFIHISVCAARSLWWKVFSIFSIVDSISVDFVLSKETRSRREDKFEIVQKKKKMCKIDRSSKLKWFICVKFKWFKIVVVFVVFCHILWKSNSHFITNFSLCLFVKFSVDFDCYTLRVN